MSGVKRNHSLIAGNLMSELKHALRGRGCEVHGPEMRVKTPSMPPYRYPDLAVVCKMPQFEAMGGLDVLTNPVLRVVMQFECGTRILRVIHGRAARATPSNSI